MASVGERYMFRTLGLPALVALGLCIPLVMHPAVWANLAAACIAGSVVAWGFRATRLAPRET